MKPILYIVFLLAAGGPAAWGQKKVEQQLPLSKGQRVHLDFEFATTIDVKTWDEPRVLVKASARVNEGLDDEAYELTATTDGDVLRFVSRLRDKEKLFRRMDSAQHVDGISQDGKHLKIKEYYEVYVPRNVQLSLKTTLGSSTIEHNNGPLAVETVTGNIELRCATSQPADITAKTVMGAMYTNLPYENQTKKGLPRLAGEESQIQLNGGGVPIALETVTGDVTIRRK
ncbi:MAG: hypothetical protein ICV83_04750 [Cytophagales bacterium]|nr:hypothetical protein [Cytophagales bacterium]